jgi:hypothetical protein
MFYLPVPVHGLQLLAEVLHDGGALVGRGVFRPGRARRARPGIDAQG